MTGFWILKSFASFVFAEKIIGQLCKNIILEEEGKRRERKEEKQEKQNKAFSLLKKRILSELGMVLLWCGGSLIQICYYIHSCNFFFAFGF